MRTGFGRRLESPLGLANIQLTDYYNMGMMITRIYVPDEHRGKGIAHELLLECLKDADHHKTTLWLEISPSGGLTYEQLEAWYTRYGFKDVGGVFRRRPEGG